MLRKKCNFDKYADYLILESTDRQDIERQVREFKAGGYKPQGGISITYRHTNTYYESMYTQAIVRE